jgi:hypothetical protein
MAWFSRNKEHERFYLLAGMGGRALRRKHRAILMWALAAGITVGMVVGSLLIWLNGRVPAGH